MTNWVVVIFVCASEVLSWESEFFMSESRNPFSFLLVFLFPLSSLCCLSLLLLAFLFVLLPQVRRHTNENHETDVPARKNAEPEQNRALR